MSLINIQTTYDTPFPPANLTGAAADVAKLTIAAAGTIKKVSVLVGANVSGDAVFAVYLNGAVQADAAVTIPSGTKKGASAAVTIAVTVGDEIVLQRVSGTIIAPVNLVVSFDDGISSSGSGGGAGILSPPVTRNAFDDEFEGSSLSGDWTKTGGAAVESYDDKIQSGYFARFNVGQDIKLSKPIAVGSEDFSITLCGQVELLENYNAMVLQVLDSGGNNGLEIDNLFAGSPKFTTHKIVSGSYTYDIGTAKDIAGDAVLSYHQSLIHFQRISGNLNVYVGINGINWFKILDNYSLGFTVQKIVVLFGTNTGTAKKVNGVLHWIRKDWLFL